MMDASTSSTDLNVRQSTHDLQHPNAPNDLSADAMVSLWQSSNDSSLWTNGLPDHEKIKNKMERRLQQFIDKKYPPVESGPFRYLREIRLRKDAQNEFYADMSYYESLLYAAPVLTLQATTSTTTIVPYEPAPKPKRGRPSTGGRKPRDRRKRPDDDPY